MNKEENTTLVEWAKKARKYLVSLAGALALAASQGLIDGPQAKWVGIGIAFLTSIGVYQVPNDKAV